MEIEEVIDLLNEHASVILDVERSGIDFVGLEAIMEAADITDSTITLTSAAKLSREQRRNLAQLGGRKVVFDFTS